MKKVSKKQTRKRRIIFALIMLLVSGIALTTATYAWFSANTAVTATGIDVKVTASAGISISADALNFGKTTSMDDVIAFAQDTKFASTLQLPEKLSPVSTGGIVGANKKFSFYKGTLGENDVVLLEDNNETTTFLTTEGKTNFTSGDYIAFDVYIRSSIDQSLKLNSNSVIGVIDGGQNTASLESALRVGFLPLGTTTDTSAETAQSSAYNLATVGSDWKIWNPYPNLHHTATLDGYADGENEASAGYYGAISNTKNVTAFSSLGETALEGDSDSHYVKFLVKDFAETPAYYTLINNENAHYAPAGSADSILPASNIFDVKAGVTKVRVYLWLEGNDVDCVDAISISDGLTVNLGFEVA